MDVPASRITTGKRTAAHAGPKLNAISWIALALMTTSSVASLRAAPTMAVYGLAAVFGGMLT